MHSIADGDNIHDFLDVALVKHVVTTLRHFIFCNRFWRQGMNCTDFMEPLVMNIVNEHHAIRHRLPGLRALVQKPADESIRGQWLAAITVPGGRC